MADYQRVIEFLRDVRQGAGSGGLQTVNEEITQIAAEYAALCVAANERLRKCSGFLSQGLRAEAIHLAEESPNLLDLIAQLDLPDPQQWADFCQNNGLPVPPPLQLERAAQLNEAYAQDQPQEQLMARHRLLALSRAPVRERLDVMRKIAGMDANGGHWEKDLRIFEQARLKELPSAFYNAVKNHDTHAINGLMEELNGQTWFEPPPADLLAAVSEAHARVVRGAVETELRKLVDPLRDAYAARSLQECQALVQRWKNLMASAGVTSVAGELMDEIRPVVAFIAEQTKRDDYVKRFNESCKAFARMLDADAGDAQLEAGYSKLKEFKEEIPDDLTRRYMNKRTGRRKEADRKHKLRLATIAGIFLVLLAGLGISGWLYYRYNKAAKWAGDINAGVAQHTHDGLEAAQHRIDDLQASDPSLLNESPLAKAWSALKVEQDNYKNDTNRVNDAVTRLDKARETAATLLAHKAAPNDEFRAVTDLAWAAKSAAQLADAVKWPDLQDRLKASADEAENLGQAMLKDVRQFAVSELKAMTDEMNALPQHPASRAQAMAVQNQIAALTQRAQRLGALPGLSDDEKEALKKVARALDALAENPEFNGSIADALENIRNSSDSAANLSNALTSFNSRFAGDPRSAEFQKALGGIPAGQSLEAWRDLLAAYAGKFAPAGLPDAQKRLEDVTTFLAAHPEFPKADDVGAYADYLKRAVDAMSGSGAWQTTLTPVATDPLLNALDFIEVSDGRRYFVFGDLKRATHALNGVVSVSFEATEVKADAKGNYAKLADLPKIKVNVDPPKLVPDAATPTPEKKTATELADALRNISESNWATFGTDFAERVARNDQLNVVSKSFFIQELVKAQVAVAGPWVGSLYDASLQKFRANNPETLTWPEPDKVSQGTRDALADAIKSLPKPADVRQKIESAQNILFKSMAVDLAGCGVLLKNDAGGWVITTGVTPLNGMIVWAIVPASGGAGASKMQMVGTAAAKEFIPDDKALSALPQGSILYITRN